MGNRLYVGNLNFQANEEDVRSLFSQHGEVRDVSLIKDPNTGRSRGFAFVEMANDESAAKAQEALNGQAFQERNLSIDWAKPKGSSRRNSSGGGRRFDRGGDFNQKRSFNRY